MILGCYIRSYLKAVKFSRGITDLLSQLYIAARIYIGIIVVCML